MPGIVGIIRHGHRDGVEQDLATMLATMHHEPFYTDGQYINHDLGLYVGWTCHQGSPCDLEPIVDRRNNRVIIFHGEHHPIEDGVSAEKYPAQFLDMLGGDLEPFLRSLNGWFCGVVADIGRRETVLFNDRYGIGRVYVHEASNEFLFASEAKSLLKMRSSLRSVEPDALAEYTRYNCVFRNKTLFKGISLLPPASSWVFERSHRPQTRQYFAPKEWETLPTLSVEHFWDRFQETASRVVPRYLHGGQRVALSLTAGLDTRLILAAIPSDAWPLPCYTFGGLWGETFDVRTARTLAKIKSSPFDIIRVDEAFLKDFPRYAERTVYISDGTHDVLGAHDVYFNQRARAIAPVRLTGKFGSEIVRIRKLIPTLTYGEGLLGRDLRARIDALPTPDQILSPHPLSRVVFEEIPWYEFGRLAIEQAYIALRTPYMDNELVSLMYQAPPQVRSRGEAQAQYVRARSRPLASVLTNLGSLGGTSPTINRLLYLPFWLLFKVEYTYLYATPHWLTRIDRALERWQPERVFSGRQKFEGYRIWLRSHFANFVRDTLLRSNSQVSDFFDRAAIHRIVAQHLAGTHNHLDEINKLLTLELMWSSLLAGA